MADRVEGLFERVKTELDTSNLTWAEIEKLEGGSEFRKSDLEALVRCRRLGSDGTGHYHVRLDEYDDAEVIFDHHDPADRRS